MLILHLVRSHVPSANLRTPCAQIVLGSGSKLTSVHKAAYPDWLCICEMNAFSILAHVSQTNMNKGWHYLLGMLSVTVSQSLHFMNTCKSSATQKGQFRIVKKPHPFISLGGSFPWGKKLLWFLRLWLTEVKVTCFLIASALKAEWNQHHWENRYLRQEKYRPCASLWSGITQLMEILLMPFLIKALIP